MFSTAEAAELAGLSYRQADYYCRVGYVTPTEDGRGSGSRRAWSPSDVVALRLVKNLMLSAYSIPEGVIREAVGLIDLGHEFLWVQGSVVGTGDTFDLLEVIPHVQETRVVNLAALRAGLPVTVPA